MKAFIRHDRGIVSIDVEDIPDSIIENCFEFEIDVQKVWGLEASIINFPVSELLWHLDSTTWEHNGKVFQVSPRQVMEYPERYSYHYNRVVSSDIKYPIDISFNNGKWIIIDGLHRFTWQLMRAQQENIEWRTIKARIHPKESLILCMDFECMPEEVSRKYLSEIEGCNIELCYSKMYRKFDNIKKFLAGK